MQETKRRGRPRKPEVQKIYDALPYEVQEQIDTTLADEGKTLNDVDKTFMIEEIKWAIESAKMDLNEFHDDDTYKEARKIIRVCDRLLKKYE